MNLTSIIIIITFAAALLEKLSSKPQGERKGLLAKIKLENIALLLLGIALLFKLYEVSKSKFDEQVESEKRELAYGNISETQEKVGEANKLIDSVLKNLITEVEFTEKEFEAIKSLNLEMSTIRTKINKNLEEFNKLNRSYSSQLEIERAKIKNEKPEVKVQYAKLLKDSTSISYQFQLTNFGKRTAEKVKYAAIMVMTDSTKTKLNSVSTIKSNNTDSNELSLIGNNNRSHIFNSHLIETSEMANYGFGYLLITYDYYDSMTEVHTKGPIVVLFCSSFEEYNAQFRLNIDKKTVVRLKKYLKYKDPNKYAIFYQDKKENR